MPYVPKNLSRDVKKYIKQNFPEIKCSVTTRGATINCYILSGPYNWPSGCFMPHYYQNNGVERRDILIDILNKLNEGNHDNSDAMTDYFDVGWYAYLSVGKWDKPYMLEKKL